jgi:hypothetical protein
MTDNIQTPNHTKLFSIIALVFFPFLVSFLLKDSKSDYDLSENDIKIINSYKKA